MIQLANGKENNSGPYIAAYTDSHCIHSKYKNSHIYDYYLYRSHTKKPGAERGDIELRTELAINERCSWGRRIKGSCGDTLRAASMTMLTAAILFQRIMRNKRDRWKEIYKNN